MSQWPDETPEEVVERTRRAYGDEMAATVAKALGWEPGPRRRQVPRKIGRQTSLGPALTSRPTGGPNLREILQAARAEPTRLVRLLTIRRSAVCPGCDTRYQRGDEMGRLSDGRLVCGPCIPALAPGRRPVTDEIPTV